MNLKKAGMGLALMLVISSASYVFFATYTPKILRKLEEVKGVRTVSTDSLPYPNDVKKIGLFETPESRQATLQTRRTLPDIEQFYRNIYQNKNYRLASEKISEASFELKFKKGDEVVTVVGSREEEANYTTFSINITTL